MAERRWTIAVVGAGITGLAAAWEIASTRDDVEVVVIESADRVGGKIATLRDDGRVIEDGPDSFVAYRPAALALIKELGLDGDVIGTLGRRSVAIRSRGRLLPMPDGMGMVLPTKIIPFATTRILTWRDKARAAVDLVLPRRLGNDDVAIGAFLRARLGPGIVRRFADPMIGGIYGASVDELSLDAVLPSLRASERQHRSLMLASLRQGRERASSPRGAGSPFRTLRHGLASLPEACARALRQRSARLILGVRVDALERGREHRTRVRLSDGGVITADGVILAGGAASSAGLLAELAPAAARALAAVPLASTAVVNLVYPAAAFPAGTPTGHGWLEADPAPVSGITVSSEKFAGRARGDEVLIRAFVPERVGPVAPDDDALVAAVRAHVEPVFGIDGEPRLARVARWDKVMPKYTVGHLDRAVTVATALADTRWRVAGSALNGVGIPDCISDGRRIAQELLTTVEGKTS